MRPRKKGGRKEGNEKKIGRWGRTGGLGCERTCGVRGSGKGNRGAAGGKREGKEKKRGNLYMKEI